MSTPTAPTLPGDVVEVVVVDLGAPEALAMFWGAVPIGDEAMIAQLDQVVSQLQRRLAGAALGCSSAR